MIEEIKCSECESYKVDYALVMEHLILGKFYNYKNYQCEECKHIFPVIEKKEDKEIKTKRYFVSYNHTYKERFGFGNIITETNSFNIREIEKFIKAECNFSDVVILYYKEMEEDEK